VNLTIRVERQLTETIDGTPTFGRPKSQAGVRTVSFPRVILTEVREHLASYVGKDDDALVFPSPAGQLLNYSNFHDRFWAKGRGQGRP
jgi:hypothetical protein